MARRRERKGSVELYAIDIGTTNDERPRVPATDHMKSMKGTKAFVDGVTFDPNREVKWRGIASRSGRRPSGAYGGFPTTSQDP
jgi:hypothetical protein